MKKLIIVLLMSVIGITAMGQVPSIFLPVKANPAFSINKLKVADSTYTTALLRFGAGLGGTETLFNKTTKQLEQSTFAKVGIGLSCAFYRVVGGTPFNYLSLNGFVFLPITDNNKTVSIAATVSAFRVFGTNLSPQLGLDFQLGLIKSDYFPVGLLGGLSYTF